MLSTTFTPDIISLMAYPHRTKAKVKNISLLLGLHYHSINLCSPSQNFAFAFAPMDPEAIKEATSLSLSLVWVYP